MLLDPKPGIVYGPVNSRRLGASLGINLLPTGTKRCTFDCAYCHFGWTAGPPLPSDAFPSPEQVLAAVEGALDKQPTAPPTFLTFSGNGEPTSHPRFLSIVEGVRALRDRRCPGSKLALLSNSTRLADANVRAALDLLDVRIMKLDAGTEVLFRRYSRPLEPITLQDVVVGLSGLRAVTLQTLFTAGIGGNAEPEHVTAWIEKVAAIRPVDVQIHTLDRPWPSNDLRPLEPQTLHDIAARLHQAGCPATVYLRR
jgi:wyosine [tRNA(Phe)-imidazoG37] synthetase (radical SAM superfamily)